MPAGVPFGRYRLLKRIAQGGMAEVFLADLVGEEGFARRVAIKRILPHLSDSEEFRGMFMEEARLAARLSHPNIVHIYDFGREGEHYYLAMELVDGLSLSQLIAESDRLPVRFEHVARIGADVCAGLYYAHQTIQLVHRDVSPQNILVTWDGVVKLVDFGIAKAAFSDRHTRPGMVKGKWTYMSPEQCEGRRLDGRSDLFALGVVLCELITGQPLYTRDDAEEAMREIRSGKPMQLERHRPDIPPPLAAILRRACAVDREARFADAGEMQLELERFLGAGGRVTTAHLLGAHLQASYDRNPLDESAGEGTAEADAGTRAAVPVSRRGPSNALIERIARTGVTNESGEARRRTISVEGAPARPGVADPAAATSLLRQSDSASGRPARAQRIALATAGALLACALTAAAWKLARPDRPREERVVGRRPPSDGGAAIRVTPMALAAPDDAAAPPSTPPVVREPGHLRAALDVTTRPAGARLLLDGRPLGGASPILGVPVSSGRHHLVLTLANHERRELDVALAPGERRSIDVELRAEVRARVPPGALTVRTLPWSKVYEGSRLLGTTPFAGVPLGAGRHALTFVNPDRPTVTRMISIKPGREERISLELPPKGR